MTNTVLYSIITGIVVFVVMIIAMFIINKQGLNRSKEQANSIINEAKEKAETTTRQAQLEAKTHAYEIKLNAEREAQEQRLELQEFESKLERRDENLNMRDANLVSKDKELLDKQRDLEVKNSKLEKMEQAINERTEVQLQELERVASMPASEAKSELFEIVEKQMEQEVLSYIKDQEETARQRADDIARNIISLAISRYAQEETTQRTSSTVSLPSEEMKGRIIGREGRNIRAFENATGVDLLIDDTPEVITLSCFDPIRREIGRMALETLMSDGRIQPGRIEEAVDKARKELNVIIQKTGQDTLFELGISKMDKEIVHVLGRLKYRYSYGQNALAHSVEVANLAGMMAAELGLNQKLAKRAGLLHDIGKGLDFELEGSHVELGVRLAKKHNEHPVVINAIASHHGDTEATSAIAVLVAAADTLSAARPGARFESFESYIQRLEDLEAVASTRDGVQRAFAIQAGRELRVIVVPDDVDDLGTIKMAREIREEIEEKLTYPGQIKVTVIRELRAMELAK
ncbi:ribonuclease Y [Erysipelothrix sp. HDW6C]|uniref:ribonuclease Y n=1 Tax=Erysipelothrix sp. HDW6C TaxID=2714930 RepID=UPI00140D97D5|nr:ribonuclease Y [Erysipelothrix sp. HDW6C]QIK69994.1 ribonuclease Y [Erysipelothrix sp. HDW6C]